MSDNRPTEPWIDDVCPVCLQEECICKESKVMSEKICVLPDKLPHELVARIILWCDRYDYVTLSDRRVMSARKNFFGNYVIALSGKKE